MNKKRKELVISVIGVLLLILSAAFCYQTVRDAIIVMKKKVFRILQKSVRIACKRRFKGKVISYMLHYRVIWQTKRV